MTESHNPTPEERDEKFSLYGLDPEKVGEALLRSERDDTQDDKESGRAEGR